MTIDVFAMSAVSVLMIIGAIIDGWKLKVPNALTLPMTVAGWAFWATFAGWQGLGLSVGGAFLAGGLLIPIWRVGGMGGGDAKLYAGFGAWAVPIPWFGFVHLLWAFAYSVILGGVMAIVMIVWSKSFQGNLANAAAIVNDLRQGGSLDAIREKATERKPSLQLLPYGIPLTLGSLTYLFYIYWQETAGAGSLGGFP
jgi:prepilin peptidase CpaA